MSLLDRRAFIGTLGLLTAPLGAEAQTAGKVYRIGLLATGSATGDRRARDANATGTIPIVMLTIADPVGRGVVASLSRPGGNVTGVTYGVGTETFGKGLEILKEAVPEARRVAVLSNPDSPTRSRMIAASRAQRGRWGWSSSSWPRAGSLSSTARSRRCARVASRRCSMTLRAGRERWR